MLPLIALGVVSCIGLVAGAWLDEVRPWAR